MSPKPPQRKIQIVILLVLLPVTFGVIAGVKQAFGGARGESCEDLSGCKFGNVCIAHKCYAKCKVDSDCPTAMHCGTTNVTVVTQGNFVRDETDGTEQICFANAAASSSAPRR